jgi:hypothetical protein
MNSKYRYENIKISKGRVRLDVPRADMNVVEDKNASPAGN